jgi:uncharacterized protein DUF4062
MPETRPRAGRQRIFLSHTSELRSVPPRRSYVAAAEAVVTRAGHVIADMAYFPPASRPPAAVCRRAVEEADALVLIAGHRYGSLLPEPESISHTEWEFRVARGIPIPRFVFFLEDDADGGDALRGDAQDAERQREFRRRLRDSGLTIATVDSPGALEATLEHTLNVEFDSSRSASGSTFGDISVRRSRNVLIGDRTVLNAGDSQHRMVRWLRRRLFR